MLAVEYIDGLAKFILPGSKEGFSHICTEFLSIMDALEANGIVHADVHKGNLMIKDDRLFLLDYGISKRDGVTNCIDYTARPGTYYKVSGTVRTYDDAYSFIKLVEELDTGCAFVNEEKLLSKKERIGRQCFTVDCGAKAR